ncbi:MAG: serine hydrolase [Candidatus Yanofskybacteria bacterium]|nr:serine hydrolase [Candidatus Yanofskybacteria bacterium]
MSKKVFYFLIILALGVMLGFLLSHLFGNPFSRKLRGKIVRQGQEGHINPVLFCEVGEKEIFKELESIKKNARFLIDKEISVGKITRASLYLRTLNAGRWFEINENEKYSPASLLKVVIMMAYFKDAEQDPSQLSRLISYDISPEDIKVPSEFRLDAGKKYKAEEIIENMIVSSSNVSMTILLKNIKQDSYHNVLSDLNMEDFIGGNQKDAGLSPRAYSLVFRALYNATYLNRTMSEKALELLAKTTFYGGLVAGVPKDISVSHKYGTRVHQESNSLELHDCGIIYYPSHPYFLCMMTEGKNLKSLEDVISRVSSKLYAELDKFYLSN